MVKRDFIYIYFELIHFVVQQNPTDHCKTIILQLKIIINIILGMKKYSKILLLTKHLYINYFLNYSTEMLTEIIYFYILANQNDHIFIVPLLKNIPY